MITIQLPAAVPSTDTDAVAPRSYLAEVRTRFAQSRWHDCGQRPRPAGRRGDGRAAAEPVRPTDRQRHTPSVAHRQRRPSLGTDEQGRDMLTRLLYGGRLSLLTGMLPVIVSTVIGTAIGATAGYLRGPVGAILMRTMDMLYSPRSCSRSPSRRRSDRA